MIAEINWKPHADLRGLTTGPVEGSDSGPGRQTYDLRNWGTLRGAFLLPQNTTGNVGLSRALHRNWLEARLGWSLIWRYKVCSPSDLIESVDGCRLFERFWKVHHRIRPKLKSDGTNLNAFCQEHHRILSRPKVDVEQVPNKLFSHHRILPRPELDVEQVPDKLFQTIEFCRDRKWM